MKLRAVFLDRDGVLVRDDGLVTRPEQLHLLPGVPEALSELKRAGFALVVVSNQAVVARGLVGEAEVRNIHDHLGEMITEAGGPLIDAWHFCPHHPNADVVEYRRVCACRKPAPGMLLAAAAELELDLAGSHMVGDRITDIEAGVTAGCRTVQVETGQHLSTRIESGSNNRVEVAPDHVCADLPVAVRWILKA